MNDIQGAIEKQRRMEKAAVRDYYAEAELEAHILNQHKLALDVIEAAVKVTEGFPEYIFSDLRAALNAWADHVNGEKP